MKVEEEEIIIKEAILPCLIQEGLEKVKIEIHLSILEGDSLYHTLAMCINVACLCLVETGIEIYDVVTSSSVGFLKDGSLNLDLQNEARDEEMGIRQV